MVVLSFVDTGRCDANAFEFSRRANLRRELARSRPDVRLYTQAISRSLAASHTSVCAAKLRAPEARLRHEVKTVSTSRRLQFLDRQGERRRRLLYRGRALGGAAAERAVVVWLIDLDIVVPAARLTPAKTYSPGRRARVGENINRESASSCGALPVRQEGAPVDRPARWMGFWQ